MEPTKISKGFNQIDLSQENIDQYFCGDKIPVEPNNSEYKKIKQTLASFDSYFTHWNNSRLFLIYISTKKD